MNLKIEEGIHGFSVRNNKVNIGNYFNNNKTSFLPQIVHNVYRCLLIVCESSSGKQNISVGCFLE